MNEIMLSLMRCYNAYNEKLNKVAYEMLRQRIAAGVTAKPFGAVLRMRNGKLALRLKMQASMIPQNLRSALMYFFCYYSLERECVWTNKENKIREFFQEGISCLKAIGGDVILEIPPKDAREIVCLLTSRYHEKDRELFDDLCNHFTKLAEYDSWEAYYHYVEMASGKVLPKEHVEEVTSMELPLDWENVFATSEVSAGVHAETVSDGLVLSLCNLGKVDMEYIAQITGEDIRDVVCALRGSVYQNPETWDECFYKGWETADEYLSGRVLKKWQVAKDANKKYQGYFEENLRALESVMPRNVAAEEIYVTLGSPWLPADVVDDFITHLLGYAYVGRKVKREDMDVQHDIFSGVWHIPMKSRYKYDVKANQTYGTSCLSALHIIERTLNMKTMAVTEDWEEYGYYGESKCRRIVNRTETLLAIEKQKLILKEFKDWVWADPKRKKRLEELFEERFGSNVVRKYCGAFLTFPGMAEHMSLFDYQKDAVARILFSPNVLLAHEVGSGKTFIMAAAGMEMRRMGISRKNMYAVPNNLVGQWQEMFSSLYPDAKLLCITAKEFTPNVRERTLKQIKSDDYDAIIIAHSVLERIPISTGSYRDEIRSELDIVCKALEEDNRKKKIKSLVNRKRKLYKELLKLEKRYVDVPDHMCFDAFGVNTLFVDEAHNYKNVPLEMNLESVRGISKNGSQKCRDMLDKVRLVQRTNGGRGVVMATGTPITNSITDIFVMQKYLQNGELTLLDLQHFNAWVGMFAEPQTEMEVDVDTTNFRFVTRLTGFHNLPELAALLSSVADFHQVDRENGIPDWDGYTETMIEKTEAFSAYLEEISDRADRVRQGTVKRTEDNMLKITVDGRHAALDLRLVDPQAPFVMESKVVKCAGNVFAVWSRTMEKKSAQLVFCDISTPKKSFNLYDELKRLLVEMGIPEKEIAFVHSATTEKARSALFEKVRTGNIRVMIGSTLRMGQGINVAEKLVAIHHLDVPWRPSDMVQREGRILRAGNENSHVELYNYITKGSFDAYSWQLLEAKQKVIAAVLSGCVSRRSTLDVDETVLGYAEVKALAIGNNLMKERVEAANELSRRVALQRQVAENRIQMERELRELPAKREHLNELLRRCMQDVKHYKRQRRDLSPEERRLYRSEIAEAVKEYEWMPQERVLMEYQGFEVVLPTNMTKDKPFLYLRKNGKYYVELGKADKGILVRVDHVLDGLRTHCRKLIATLKMLKQKEKDLKQELAKDYGHSDAIIELTKKIQHLDEALGVKQYA